MLSGAKAERLGLSGEVSPVLSPQTELWAEESEKEATQPLSFDSSCLR